MTDIQVILLFTKKSALSSQQQKRVTEIIGEEYGRIFSENPEDVRITLYDGTGKNTDSDVHLCITADRSYYNEGALRAKVREAVSRRLAILLPDTKGSGYVVTCADSRGEAGNAGEGSGGSPVPDSYTARASMYVAAPPRYSFDMVKLPEHVMEEIRQALGRIEYEEKVFSKWGLYAIMPSPATALSFYGPPGTGKTLAAEAVAHKLGRNIIRASYADIENKYVGEGPKNVKAIFLAAEQQGAVLFIDEADSLLSKRLTNVSDGSGQALNSMRSQLLICLEQFHGIVIFATNLMVNYDRAFLSRLIHIRFELPDAAMREEIWKAHLYPRENNGCRLRIPLARDIDLKKLADAYELCGRDIRNAVVAACVEACRRGLGEVNQACLLHAAASEERRGQEAAQAGDEAVGGNAERLDGNMKKRMARVLEEKAAENRR